jgi:hypothetical protein
VELVEQNDNMLIVEFDNPETTKLVAIVDQLKNDLDNGKIVGEWNVDQLLKYFQKYDIVDIDITDLYDLIKKPPMNKVIANIQGDKIVWKGTESVPGEVTDKNEKVVQQMAKNALK